MKNKKALLRRVGVFLKYFVIFFFASTIFSVLVYRFVPVPFTPLMFQRAIEQKFDGEKIHIKHQWVSIKNISPNMVLAAVAAEDNNFINHSGIDREAIKKAYQYNKRGRRIRGASTITQQTCKNVYPWLGRSYIRKGLELYFTVMVEMVWSKKRIMEVYLNSIEMGKGIFGIEAAARTYFKKSASKLTRGEAAMIAAAFPNPRKRNPAAPGIYLLRRHQEILTIMDQIGKVDL